MRWRTAPCPAVWARASRGSQRWGKASAAAPAPRPWSSRRRPRETDFVSSESDMGGSPGLVEDALGAGEQREAVGTGEGFGRAQGEGALRARVARLGQLRVIRRAPEQQPVLVGGDLR